MAIQRISPIRPIAFGSSGQKSVLGYSSWPKRKTLTSQQVFEMEMAKKMERHSFLDKVKHAGSVAFSPVEWTFDKILRPSYAMAEGFRAATEAPGQQKLLELDMGKFAHGLREGFMGRKKTGFGQVLEQEGVLKGHRRLRGLAGFGMDVLFDPTTYLTLGTSVAATGGMRVAHAAGRKIIHGGIKDIDELKAARKVLEDAGPQFKFRAGAAKELERRTLRETVEEGDNSVLAQLREMAKREEKRVSKKLPYAQIGLIRTPTHIGGRQVVPTLPKVGKALRTKNIPGVSKFVGGLRHAVGSELDDELRGMRVTQKHTVEELTKEYLDVIREMTRGLPRFGSQRAISALHHFEKPGGVIKVKAEDGSVDYVLNEQRIAELKADPNVKFDDDDAKFVELWHNVSQYIHHTDESFGIKYAHQGEKGKLYVPHLVDRSGVPYSRAEKNMLKQAGYTKARRGDMTLAMVQTALKEGRFPKQMDIETDPYKLLVTMARTRAHAHADRAALDALAKGIGVSTRIVGPRQAKKIKENEKAIEELEEKMLKYDSPSKKNLKQYRDGMAKLDALRAETKKLKRGKKNKAATRDMVDVDASGKYVDEFGNKILVDREIGQAIQRIEKILDPTEDRTIQQFAKAFAGAQGRWKLLATAVNPGYRVRNTLSDFWNMYVAGVPFWAMVTYSGRAATLMRKAKKGDEVATRKLSEAYKAGVLSGLFGGDIGTLSRMLQYHGSKTALLRRGRGLKFASKAMQDMNRNAENMGRLVHYLYRREHEGKGVIDAAWDVKKAHFDYEDLTEFERKKIKGMVIPFYTWSRKNVPFQIQALISRPGKYAAFPKLAMESDYAAGGEGDDIVPDYLAENFSFKVPFGKDTYYTPQLGVSDLARFQTPGGALKNTAMMVTPFAKVPAELMLNRNLMTGADIQGTHPRNPISERFAPFMSLLPGANVGMTSREVGGKREVGAGADPRWIHALSQFPWARTAVQGGSRIRKKQRGLGAEWSQIFGITATSVNREQQLLIEQMELKDKLRRRIQGLRDEGRYPLAEKRTSPYQQSINEQIQFGLGR
jgi:hypothetical protein